MIRASKQASKQAARWKSVVESWFSVAPQRRVCRLKFSQVSTFQAACRKVSPDFMGNADLGNADLGNADLGSAEWGSAESGLDR